MAMRTRELTLEVDGKDFVAGLANGLAVLKAFDSGRERMTQSEVAAATGLTRPTARRSLLTLQALGYVQADAYNRYLLAPRVLELASGYLGSESPWLGIAQPYLLDLRDTLNENVSLSILDGEDVVYISSYPADRDISLNVRLGDRRPAYATAMGRVLLAQMPEEAALRVLEKSDRRPLTPQTVTDVDALMAAVAAARAADSSVIDGELEAGLVAVAVPVRNARGHVLAALNICGHSIQSPVEHLVEVALPEARRVARRLAEVLP
jgi:IclR family pca regulon transcriptional regulator